MTCENGFTVKIGEIRPEEEGNARDLILKSMREHWAEAFDPERFPDLHSIQRSYDGGVFLVARQGGNVVGTGALLPEGERTFRVCRMAVVRALRRKGIGTALFDELHQQAGIRGAQALLVETTASWKTARDFYSKLGFVEIAVRDGDVHFRYDL